MAFRLYIVPVIAFGPHNARAPKYFQDGTIDLSQYPDGFASYIDYPSASSGNLMVAADLTASDDNLVIGKADAFGLPFDLAPNLNAGQVTSVQNKLESINVPAGWVNTSLTWIFVLRTVLGMFSFLQRFVERYAAVNGGVILDIFSGRSLSSTFSSLPLAVRTALTDAANSFNLDTSGITGASTLRQILKIMADQFTTTQYKFRDVLI